MNLPLTLLTTGLSFCFLVLVFRPLELCFPARRGQRFFRPAWLTDLCFFLGQYLLWGGVVLSVLTYFRHGLDGIVPQRIRDGVAVSARAGVSARVRISARPDHGESLCTPAAAGVAPRRPRHLVG